VRLAAADKKVRISKRSRWEAEGRECDHQKQGEDELARV
jgi:hypothetical protein